MRIAISRTDGIRNSPGFTLVELLVVLALGAIMFAAALPLVTRDRSAVELKAAARNLTSGLRAARAEAINRNREVRFLVDVKQRRYRVVGGKHEGTLPDRISLELSTARSEVNNVDSGAIRFFPDGSSTGGRIALTGGRRSYVVAVDWLTGRVSVVE